MEATKSNDDNADAGSSPPSFVHLPPQWNMAAQQSSIVANAIGRLTLGGPTTMDGDVAAWNKLAIDDCSKDDDDDDSIISISGSSSVFERGDDGSWQKSSSSLSSTSQSSDDLFIVDEPDPTSTCIAVNNGATSSSKKGSASSKSSRKKKSKKAKLPPNQRTLRGFVSSNTVSWSDDDKCDEGAKSDGSNWSDDMGRPTKKKKKTKKTTKAKRKTAATSISTKKKRASGDAKSGQKKLGSYGISKTSISPASNSLHAASGQGKKPYAVGSSVVLRNLSSHEMVELNGKRGTITSKMNDGKQDVDVNGQIMSMQLDNLRGVCPLFLSK